MTVDAESIAVGRLREILGVPVSAETVRGRKPPYATVERTGGPCDGYLDGAEIAVQCWGEDRASAKRLALRAREALAGLADDPRAAGCEIGSLSWFPAEHGEARYQIAATLTLYI